MKFRCNQMMLPYKFYTFYRDQSLKGFEPWVKDVFWEYK